MTRHDVLIDAVELRERMRQPDAPLVVDVRFRLGQPDWGLAQYRAAHVPGSVFVDVEHELSAPRPDGRGGRHPLPSQTDFQQVMRRVGLRVGQPVVALDSGDCMGAARLWWLLRHHGHDRVRVLAGGIEAWRQSGGELTQQPVQAAEGDFVALPGRLPVVSSDDLPGMQDAGHRVVDVRAEQRFRGEHEPIDPVAGHIPGAVNLPADQVGQRIGELREGDVLTCGSGLTATRVLLAGQAAGVDGLWLHAGSWSDWITDDTREVTCEI
ncbi:sulfurtransferase [Luteococcus sp. OSA5]|uniref:sulfurtransferase n=1 Tax=Luteococcus sp. OSA5 TaxID=3401630 RepID=UPI003B42F09F